LDDERYVSEIIVGEPIHLMVSVTGASSIKASEPIADHFRLRPLLCEVFSPLRIEPPKS